LIMAEGYNHELLKSEAEMLEELQQAVGEALWLLPVPSQTSRTAGTVVVSCAPGPMERHALVLKQSQGMSVAF